MLRLVIDTNVVLDLFHFADPAALPLLAAREAGRAQFFTDGAALDELSRVVAYPEFGLSAMAGQELVTRYRQLVLPVEPGEVPKLPKCRDRDDQKFLELAFRCQAGLLVSKDKALLKLKGRTNLPFRIVKPAEAAAILENQ
jgi:putative PIN family toxin of toxin-antitoxin system